MLEGGGGEPGGLISSLRRGLVGGSGRVEGGKNFSG